MKIQYKELTIEIKKDEKLPIEFLNIVEELEMMLKIMKDRLQRGLPPIPSNK